MNDNLCKIMLINLRGDYQNLQRFEGAIEVYGKIDWERIEGVYGSSLPDNVCIKLTRDPYSIIAKGALGCFLSHVRAWETLVHSEKTYALIIEDDAALVDLSFVVECNFPPEFDIIFSNDRTNPHDDWTTVNSAISLLPIIESAPRIEKRKMAVGTDSYIESKSGAAKLLDALKHDLYFGHVDLRLFAYCTRLNELEARVGQGAFLYDAVSKVQRACNREGYLIGYSLSRSITVHTATRDTSRTREDKLGLSGADPSKAKS